MKISLSVLLLILCLMATGCAKDYIETLDDLDIQEKLRIKSHVININKDGEYRPLFTSPNTDTESSLTTLEKGQYDLIINQIDAFLEKVNSCKSPPNKKNILIYAHGGLNSDEAAMKRAVAATDTMMPPLDNLACADTYPVFINWRSGPFTTLGDHYFRIRDGEVSETAPYTSPIYMVGDLAKTIGNTPMAWYHEGYQVINTTFLSNDEQDLENDACRGEVSFDTEKDKEHRWNFWRRTVWVVTAPFKLITTPFVFTFGTPAWDNMKRRTHTMFTAQKDFEKPGNSGLTTRPPNGATLRFLKRLNDHVKQARKNHPELELTMMGHSMGGIIINRALRDLPDLEVDNIVYMASADNLQNYLDTTLPLVEKRKNLQIYNLHLHPENEDREISSGGLAPSGSLLAWIDHTYDTPEYILQRTSGRWSNIRRVRNFIPVTSLTNYHFTVFGRGSTKERPQTHGSFDDFNFWEKSYWTGNQIYWTGNAAN